MSDGNALFHADHSSFVASGSGAAPSVNTLSAARLAIRTQTGLKSEVLNLSPRHLIVPAALETTCDQLLNSLASLDDNKNAGVVNPFHKKLELVVDPTLDSTSATGWYLAADQTQFDTVECAFLDGQSRPFLDSKDGWTVDGVEYKVRIDFGCKAIDWRGLYFNYGA